MGFISRTVLLLHLIVLTCLDRVKAEASELCCVSASPGAAQPQVLLQLLVQPDPGPERYQEALPPQVTDQVTSSCRSSNQVINKVT